MDNDFDTPQLVNFQPAKVLTVLAKLLARHEGVDVDVTVTQKEKTA